MMQKSIFIVVFIILTIIAGLFITGNIVIVSDEEYSKKIEYDNSITAEAEKEIETLTAKIKEQAKKEVVEEPSSDPQISYNYVAEEKQRRNLAIASHVSSQMEGAVGLDGEQVTEMTSLMENKLTRDQNAAEEINWFYTQQQEKMYLIRAEESELTENELAERKKIIEGVDSLTAVLEQNRRDYENDLRSLLSEDEMFAYQKEEVRQVKESLSGFMEGIVARVQNVSDIQEYQLQEVNSITKSYSQKSLEGWPIGATVNLQGQAMSSSDPKSIELLMAYQQEIAGNLTPQQMEEYQKSIILEAEEAGKGLF